MFAGKSCGKILWEKEEGKSQFKKGSDWWKFSIWNTVMGSQPIRIQCRKMFAGKSCGKILRENVCGKMFAGKSCGKILREIFAGKSCGKSLWEIFAGKSCGKSCGKILQEILWEMLWEIPHTYLQTISEGNFQNMQFI